MNEIDILDEISYIGFLLLRYGADIYRVEESLQKMMEGLGYKDVEVFAMPTYFTLSTTLKNHTPYCITKRSTTNHIHLDKLHALNSLVRDISNNKIEVNDIHDEIMNILEQPLNYRLILLGYIISSAAFTLFFGGELKDMAVGAVSGFIIYYAILIMENLRINSIMRTIIASMIAASVSVIFRSLGIIDSVEYSIIGTLMILTPGLAITNSVRDFIRGDFVSGMSRLAEAFLIAASIAVGVGTILMIGG